MTLKLVFYVEDSKTKEIVVEKSQVILEIKEEELVRADEIDATKLSAANALIGEGYANQSMNGRSKFVREIFQAAGVCVAKFLDRSLSPRFGCRHIEMLDA